MQKTLAVLGLLVVLVYAIGGAVVAGHLALTAATGLSLEDTVNAMRAADQPYSMVQPMVFATIGVVLGATWFIATVIPAIPLSGWYSVSVWGIVLALGGPAYAIAAFTNMMSVGDTFAGPRPANAFDLEAMLYITSLFGAIIGVAAFAIALFVSFRRYRASVNA